MDIIIEKAREALLNFLGSNEDFVVKKLFEDNNVFKIIFVSDLKNTNKVLYGKNHQVNENFIHLFKESLNYISHDFGFTKKIVVEVETYNGN